MTTASPIHFIREPHMIGADLLGRLFCARRIWGKRLSARAFGRSAMGRGWFAYVPAPGGYWFVLIAA